MKKPIEWECVIGGKSYAFSYQKIKGKHTLTANGVPHIIKTGFVSAFLGIDEKFDLDGMEARFVIEKNKPDVVVDNVYVHSGKNYIQRPTWAIVFAFICIAIPFVSLGGALPAVLGFVGAAMCISVAKSSMPLAVRIILSVLITLVAWILWFALIVGVSMLG